MGEWDLEYEGYDPAEQGLRESLCTLANGYFGTRGAFSEVTSDETHHPGTYVAGLFNRLVTDIDGRAVENEDMVNVANWLPLTFRIDGGEWFSVDEVDLLEHKVTLELRRGVLVRRLRFRDGQGRETSLTQRRIVHMGCKHLGALEASIRAENWSGTLTVRSTLDGTVCNSGVARYSQLANRHLEVLDAGPAPEDPELVVLRTRTTQSRVEIVHAMRTVAFLDDVEVDAGLRYIDDGEGHVGHELSLQVGEGAICRIEKTVSLHTSRDRAISEPLLAAVEELRFCGTFSDLLYSHVLEWDGLWDRFGMRIDGVERAELVFRIHLFHLLQVAAPATLDLDVGIPARGLHGEAYRGHLFWDEMFIFPMLNFRAARIARQLLLYRHRRLPAARRAARIAGFRGAMFPWQSGSSGREETQTLHLNPDSGRWLPDQSHRQRHINSAIAYNVWQYVQVSGDVDFLAESGAELFIDIARFWGSLATFDTVDDRYDIEGVVGPDEFHDQDPNWDGPGLRNNAYTNVMAAWVLAHAEVLLERLPEVERRRLVDRLQIQRDELDLWDHVSRRLRVPFHDGGIISQFEGYEALDELDWDDYRQRHGDIHRLDRILEAEGDDVNRYKASKQADVLMLPYLFSSNELAALFERLGYELQPETLPATIDYYLDRTSHGSTLSGVVHSWVMARADRVGSLKLFRDALEADVSDVQGGTTAEGIHLGAMAGVVDLAQRGYTGMVVGDGCLRFEPMLPEGIDLLEFRIKYQNRWMTVTLEPGRLEITCDVTDRDPVVICHGGESAELTSGATIEFAVVNGGRPR